MINYGFYFDIGNLAHSCQNPPMFLMRQLGAMQRLLNAVINSFQQSGRAVAITCKIICSNRQI